MFGDKIVSENFFCMSKTKVVTSQNLVLVKFDKNLNQNTESSCNSSIL